MITLRGELQAAAIEILHFFRDASRAYDELDKVDRTIKTCRRAYFSIIYYWRANHMLVRNTLRSRARASLQHRRRRKIAAEASRHATLFLAHTAYRRQSTISDAAHARSQLARR